MKCPICGSYLDDDGLCGECDVSDILDFAGRKEMEDQYTLTGLDTLTVDSDSEVTLDIDPVNKPIHYNQAGIECIDAIEAMTENMPGYLAPHAANVLKYLWRCEYKNGLEDIDKAIWYLQRMRKRWVDNHR